MVTRGSGRRTLDRVAAAVLVVALAGAADVRAASFAVDSTGDAVDETPGDGICRAAGSLCTLRAAVMEANAWPGADTVLLPPGTYALTAEGEDDAGAQGDLDVVDSLTVFGAGPQQTVVSGNGSSRVFESTASRLALVGLTLRDGYVGGEGGAVKAYGRLVLRRVVVEANRANVGGGVLASGGLRMIQTVIARNTATLAPGLATGGSGRIRSSTVAQNAYEDGYESPIGGRDILTTGAGRLTIVNTTIGEIGNISYCEPPPQFGCYPGTDVVLASVTADLTSFNFNYGPGGSYRARNTVIGTCGAHLTSGGYLLLGTRWLCSVDGDMSGVMMEIDPGLGSLLDNGGPTPTRLPLPGSPAVDAGNPAAPGTGAPACPAVDQRGIERSTGGRCDLGAVEISQ